MSEQYDLWDGREPPQGNPHEAAFWDFHRDNPDVYRLFNRFAMEAVARGRPRFSAYMIFERMRWHTMIETSHSEYKGTIYLTPALFRRRR